MRLLHLSILFLIACTFTPIGTIPTGSLSQQQDFESKILGVWEYYGSKNMMYSNPDTVFYPIPRDMVFEDDHRFKTCDNLEWLNYRIKEDYITLYLETYKIEVLNESSMVLIHEDPYYPKEVKYLYFRRVEEFDCEF